MPASPRHYTKDVTVITAIKALDSLCDGAVSKDGTGFSRFDREKYAKIIDKAIFEGYLEPKEEEKAYRFLGRYKKQLKGLKINFDEIGHIPRADNETDIGDIIKRIPKWIEEHHFKTVADTERLYHYDHGVYLDDGEKVLKEIIEAEFGDVTNNKMVADVVGKVKRRTYVDRDAFNSQKVLNVRNGLLDLETLKIRTHTPDCLSTAQLDVLYDPDATCPRIQQFLAEVAQSKDIPLIEEIIGWMLWPDYNVHKAVMLLGPGRNGKGTLLRLITALLGKKSISNVNLQELVADKFAKADLYGKLANIGGDLPSKDLSDTAAFRNLTGGDDNRAQEKYRPAFSFRNQAKMMFSANVLPRSPDDTFAFYSRWILIEFLNIFDVQKGTGDPGLDAKLQTPEELSGLLNIALAGLARLRGNGWKFSYDKTVEDVEVMYKRNANPVYAFLMDECVSGGATDYIEKTTLSACFNEYVRKHNLRPISSTKFGELIKDQDLIPVSAFRPWEPYGTDRPMCWQGIKFKPPYWGPRLDSPYWGKDIWDDRSIFIERESLSGGPSIPSRVLPTPRYLQNGKADEIKKNKREGGIRSSIDGIDGPADADLAGKVSQLSVDKAVNPDGGSIKDGLDRAKAEEADREEHFDTPKSKKSGPEEPKPISCAVCGADLNGHGRVQKGDKFYCAKPGCGYPAREN